MKPLMMTLLLASLLSGPAALAQSEAPAPRTRTGQAEELENLLVRTDYLSTGKINGAEIQAVIITPAGKPALKGLLVYAPVSATQPEGSVFLDADEIPPLIKSMNELSALKTDFPDTIGHSEYRHKTRDGLILGFYVKSKSEFAWFLLIGERLIKLDQDQLRELAAAVGKAQALLTL